MMRIFKKNRLVTFTLLLLVMCVSCQCNKPAPEYTFPEGGQKPDGKPEEPKSKPCFIWIDAAANFPDFANNKANIARDLARAKDCGFTHVIVDVRPTSGDVLFKSDHCEQVKWLAAWVNGVYTKVERTADFDYLQEFIDKGHELGLKVYAGVNTFVGGVRSGLGANGVVFRDEELRRHATCVYTGNGVESVYENGGHEVFLNPVSTEVQAYVLQLLADLAAYGKSGLDGIVLDRARFMDYNSDVSDCSRKAFEKYTGKQMVHWPADVMKPDMNIGVPKPVPPYYQKWMEFRVKTIHDFMEKARKQVKEVNEKIDFCVYVGAWYSQYYTNGVNWASCTYDTAKYFQEGWASPDYGKYGFAELLDILFVGAYASPDRVYGSNEWTMQGFCRQAADKTKGKCMLVGGPDVGNWDPENRVSQSEENAAIVKSVKACAQECDGYFLFDMIHLKLADQWKYAKEGIVELRRSEN